jgi:hypothetical protein
MKLFPFVPAFAAGITILAHSGMCNSAMFIATTSNPDNGFQPLAASAMFSLTGNQLTIQVSNTAANGGQRYVDTDVLTAVFFSSQPEHLTPVAATAAQTVDPAGNTVCSGACDVGSGWQYATLHSTPYGLMNGISAAPFGVFLQGNFNNIPAPLGGTGYGILPTTYAASHGTILEDLPYDRGSTTFTLLVPHTFSLASIDRVVFQWGTLFNDPSAQGGFFVGAFQEEAPEPTTWTLIPCALGVFAARRRLSRAAARPR